MSHYLASQPITRVRLSEVFLIAASLFGCVTGCGRQGPPLPPVRLVPQPLAELRAAQRGERIEISYRTPAASVDGRRLPLIKVELLWATDDGDLLHVARRRMRKAAPGERLTDVIEPLPPSGKLLRVSGRAHATRRVSALATEVGLKVQAPPPAPLDLSARRENQDALLSWTAPTLSRCSPSRIESDEEADECPTIVGYNIYRRAADEQRVERLDETMTALAYRDATAMPDKSWCYSVTTLISIEPLVESSPSIEACVGASLETGSEISYSGEPQSLIEAAHSPLR
jgi:predicted small lipoprotein YifL